MAELDPALQDEISNLQTRHTALVDAVRNYSGGSIAQATNDLLAAQAQTESTIDERETALLGLIQQQTDKPVPSLMLDFLERIYMRGARRLEHGIDPYSILSVNRGSTKWVWGSQGKLEEIPADTIAYEYSPTTGEPLGHLNEPVSTNEIPECNNWGVNTNEVDRPGGADAFPGGKSGTTADRIVPTSVSDNHFVRQPNNPDNTDADISYYFHFKPQGYEQVQIRVNGFGGSVGATFHAGSETVTWMAPDTTYVRIVPLPDGWYRCEVAGTVVTGGNGSFVHIFIMDGNDNKSFAGDGTSGIDVYWGQLEIRNAPTSPIWTNGSTETRQSDNIQVVADGWQNRRQASLHVEMSVKEGGEKEDNVATLGAGRGNERMVLSKEGQMYVTTPEGSNFNGNSYDLNFHPEFTRYAVSYEEAGSMHMTIDNGANSRSPGAMNGKHLDVTRMTLGTQHTSATDVINGYIRRVHYYPFMMDLADLEALQ
ncbi:hypothetical protein FZZ93_05855 [Halomonas eurihalina]|uniref:Uncharacterized protein n=1 Tax=Halomonas eurihalina TaxID=42566 RepID=A0A5D9D965_HALER|nr:hypothetical protein [Halomonas eurihalina]MDR5859392.1 hypothetical protein [Halomonas eurihalina]TZG40568.1 hypothetical protein FZZ93_05855 [Halomonas eurihalina]